MSLPSSGVLQNSQCTINAAGSSVSASGTTLTLTLAVTFRPGFAGTRFFTRRLAVTLKTPGWQALGTWNVPGAAPTGPAVGGVTPGRSSTNG